MHDVSDESGGRASDAASDGQWLTYAEIGARRGVSLRAAVRMVQRQRMRRQPGNDGRVRIWVPRDMLEPARRAAQGPSQALSQRSVRSDGAGDESGAVAALKSAYLGQIEALHGQLTAKDGQVVALREQVAAHAATINAQARVIAQSEVRTKELEQALEGARTAHSEVESRAGELQRQIDERRGRGRWARLREAWRGN
jgi:hypothetical protein